MGLRHKGLRPSYRQLCVSLSSCSEVCVADSGIGSGRICQQLPKVWEDGKGQGRSKAPGQVQDYLNRGRGRQAQAPGFAPGFALGSQGGQPALHRMIQSLSC